MHRYRSWRIVPLAVALAMPGAWAQEPATRAEVEKRLQALRGDITRLQQQLEQARTSLQRESGQLKAADLEIQQRALRLRELDRQRLLHQGELQRLEEERQAFLVQLDRKGEVLEAQLLAAWRLGRESRLKLVLNQDDPAQLTRLLAYYDHFSAAQADAIVQLRGVLRHLDELRTATDQELAALDAVKAEHQVADQRLAEQRGERQEMVTALQAKIGSDASRLEELQRDRADLETLLERLSNALADIPSDLGTQDHPVDLRGRLPMPVSGRVLHAFGQTRAAGLAWQGWLVEARRGEEIRAIAYGRVAYADWLRGYGLLLIIDHGAGFMSLYGNNESLLFEVGQWVQPGMVIATVGAYPETGPGLYFELRHSGRAVDPAAWIKR